MLFFLKKFSRSTFVRRKSDLIQVVSMHHFSPREKLVLIDVMDKRLLLGVTTQSIQNLAEMDVVKKESNLDGCSKSIAKSSLKNSSESSSKNSSKNSSKSSTKSSTTDESSSVINFKSRFPNIFKLIKEGRS